MPDERSKPTAYQRNVDTINRITKSLVGPDLDRIGHTIANTISGPAGEPIGAALRRALTAGSLDNKTPYGARIKDAVRLSASGERQVRPTNLAAIFAKINAASAVDIPTPTRRQWSLVTEIVESQEIDDEFFEYAEVAVRSEPILSDAFDAASDVLGVVYTDLDLTRARRLFVTYFFFLFTMIVIFVMTVSPLAGAVIGASGFGGLNGGQLMGRFFDEFLREYDSGEDEPDVAGDE